MKRFILGLIALLFFVGGILLIFQGNALFGGGGHRRWLILGGASILVGILLALGTLRRKK